jgi:hypothetical protein
MSKLHIPFTIPVELFSGDKQIVNIKQKHIDAIIGSIKYNSRLNSLDVIISNNFGIITLIETKIKLDNNALKFDLILTTEKPCGKSIEEIEEVIWSVLPSAYSSDETYTFEFSIDELFYPKRYKLKILNTPNILNVTTQN